MRVVHGFLLCAVILIPTIETKPYLNKAIDIQENNLEIPNIRIIRDIFGHHTCPAGSKFVQGKCRQEKIYKVAFYDNY